MQPEEHPKAEVADHIKSSLYHLVDDYLFLRKDSGPERAVALILLKSKEFLVQAYGSALGLTAKAVEENHGETN